MSTQIEQTKTKKNVLEKEILEEMHKRIVKSFLDLAIMTKLMEGKPLSGYDLLTFFQRKFDIILSPGTVYSALYYMERDQLANSVGTKRKRVYTLTEKGEKTIKSILNRVEEFQGFFKELFCE